MSILEASAPISPPVERQDRAIANLHIGFGAQREAFAADRYPSRQERKRRIEALIGMMLANREAISGLPIAALSADGRGGGADSIARTCLYRHQPHARRRCISAIRARTHQNMPLVCDGDLRVES